MNEVNKASELLQHLKENYAVGESHSIHFPTLAQDTGLSNEALDEALNSLELDRYIDQYVLGSTNYFTLILADKVYGA